MESGQLKKMNVVSFPDNRFQDGTQGDSYEVLVNPDTYSITYEIVKSSQKAQGNALPIRTYNHSPSQTLTFKFLFDGTGVIQSGGGLAGVDITPAVPGSSKNKKNVTAEINKFKNIVYGYDGKVHQPQYVQLQWGTLQYNCSLQTMTVTYKLFSPDGSPLRAEVECTFISEINAKGLIQIQKMQSPDLTHVRTVQRGDTLDLLCYREYGDSKYYYEIAKFNRLTNFKILIPGTKLIFPPFAK